MAGEADRLKKENEELRQLLLTATWNVRSEEVWKPALHAYQKAMRESMGIEETAQKAKSPDHVEQLERRLDELEKRVDHHLRSLTLMSLEVEALKSRRWWKR